MMTLSYMWRYQLMTVLSMAQRIPRWSTKIGLVRSMTHKVGDILDFVKLKVTECGTLKYASDEGVFNRFVLQVMDSKDFILHRAVPLAFVDHIFRCVRMQNTLSWFLSSIC